MASANQIFAKGRVVEVMSHGAYRVQLANGHRCIARVLGKQPPEPINLTTGDSVRLEFHPYDLSRGRIVLPEG